MSRKSKHRKSEAQDFGGLDLAKFSLPSGGDVPASQSMFVIGEAVQGFDVPKHLLQSVPDGTVPEDKSVTIHVNKFSGLRLFEARYKSPMQLAGRRVGNGIVVVGNGVRFWTARETDFTPVDHEFDYSIQHMQTDWLPVLGNTKGLYLHEQQ